MISPYQQALKHEQKISALNTTITTKKLQEELLETQRKLMKELEEKNG